MRLALAALVCLLSLVACADNDDDRTTSSATIVTTVGTATVPATTSGSTGVATTAPLEPTTTEPTPSQTTTGPATGPTTLPDPSTTAGPDATTADPTAAQTTTGGDLDPLACPPQLPLDCEPGPGSGEPDTCAKATSCFLELVKQGVQDVIAANPAWFTDEGGGAYLVLDLEAYMNAVVAAVAMQAVCVIRDPNAGDEIAVKHDNGYAESFDILSADNHARYGDLIYTATCAPAWF